MSNIGTAASGKVLQAQGATSNASYSTATYPATTTAFQLLASTATNTIGEITAGITGTVLIGATGAIPAFSATPTVTSINFGGNDLSNYTENTYVPTFIGGTTPGTTTYTNQQGYYIRVGNIVTVWATVTGSGSTGTGTVTFGNLPFTVKNVTNFLPPGSVYQQIAYTWPVGHTTVTIQGQTNSTTAILIGFGNSVNAAGVVMANVPFNYQYTLTYQI